MSFQLDRTYGLNSDYWYRLEHSSSEIAHRLFFESSPDKETQDFLDKSNEISCNVFWQKIRDIGARILRHIYAETDVIGIMGFGNMYLFSEQQFSKFLGIEQSVWDATNKTVLDLGAGNGNITQHMRGFYNNVYATDLSSKMKNRLVSKGYIILDAIEWVTVKDVKFDLITCFNLIDRHYSPGTLLRDLRRASLRCNCQVILSVVLPIVQYVEFNPTGNSMEPDKYLNLSGNTFAEQVHYMIVNVFEPAGFEVIRWTKLPYLCEGVQAEPVYYLPNAVFLLEPNKTGDGAEETSSSGSDSDASYSSNSSENSSSTSDTDDASSSFATDDDEPNNHSNDSNTA